MNYTSSFKQKCFNNLRFCANININELMKALEDGNDTLVRWSLEDTLDDQELYEKDKVTDDGDRIVLNAKINAFKIRQEIYSEFMEQLTTVLDGKLIET